MNDVFQATALSKIVISEKITFGLATPVQRCNAGSPVVVGIVVVTVVDVGVVVEVSVVDDVVVSVVVVGVVVEVSVVVIEVVVGFVVDVDVSVINQQKHSV